MKRILFFAIIGMCMWVTSSAWSYNEEMAGSYAKLFSPVVGAKGAKALHVMKPDVFVRNIISRGEKFMTIDVRMPAETQFFSMSLPNSLIIPLNQLFRPKNLDRIPTDKTVVIMCKSGMRSFVAGTALRHIGFDNVYTLKGGFKALSSYLGPKEAYQNPVKAGK